MTKKIMIGVFSYNEGRNLQNIINQLMEQTNGMEVKIVLMDESDDEGSIEIARNLISEYHLEHYGDWHSRMGKVPWINVLFRHFLESDADILLHFDADQVLYNNCVNEMVNALSQGFDVIAALNLCMPGRNLFERAIRVMVRPGEMLRAMPHYRFPLVGHNGGYSRRALSAIYPLPETGADEELYILYTALLKGMKCAVIPSAKAYFRTVSNISDYISGGRRVIGAEISFVEGRFDTDAHDKSAQNVDKEHEAERKKLREDIYKRPPLSFIVRAVMEDLPAAMVIPFVLVIRAGIFRSAKPYGSNVWSTVKSTKELQRTR
jgi:glycosyltransferase involved in cell wall biosynthesis